MSWEDTSGKTGSQGLGSQEDPRQAGWRTNEELLSRPEGLRSKAHAVSSMWKVRGLETQRAPEWAEERSMMRRVPAWAVRQNEVHPTLPCFTPSSSQKHPVHPPRIICLYERAFCALGTLHLKLAATHRHMLPSNFIYPLTEKFLSGSILLIHLSFISTHTDH